MNSEHFTWHVQYSDGTELSEYDEQQTDGRGWLEVEQERVKVVYLLDPDPSLTISHRVLLPSGATPVFFRRRVISLSGDGQRGTAHCIGWRSEESACYLFVFGDGSTLLTDDLQAV